MSIASALSRSAHLEQVSVVASSLPSPAHQFAKLWNCKHTNVSITRNAQKQLHCGGLWVRHGVSKSRVVKTIRKLNRLNIITIVKIYMLFKKPMSATSKALLVNPGSFLRLMDTKIISCKEMHSCRCTSSGKNLSTAVGVILVGAWRCRLEIRLHTNMNFLKLKPCAQWKGFPHLEWTSQKKTKTLQVITISQLAFLLGTFSNKNHRTPPPSSKLTTSQEMTPFWPGTGSSFGELEHRSRSLADR